MGVLKIKIKYICIFMLYELFSSSVTNAGYQPLESGTTPAEELFCDPEPFEHFYLENGQNILHKNHWKKTRSGEIGTLQDICLFSNKSTVFRRCLLDSDHHPIWDSIPKREEAIICVNSSREHIITKELNELDNLIFREDVSITPSNITLEVLNLLIIPNIQLLPVDVHLIANILKEVEINDLVDPYEPNDPNDDRFETTRNVLCICQELMKSGSDVLRSTSVYNSTNVILNTLEKRLNALSSDVVSDKKCEQNMNVLINASSTTNADTMIFLDNSTLGVYAELLPNISVFYVNPTCNEVAGIAIYDHDTESTTRSLNLWKFSNGYSFKYGFIYFNDSINSLRMEPKMRVASFVTKSIWKTIKQKLNETSQQAALVLKYFSSDALFVENTASKWESFGQVLSISVPNYHGRFDDPLPYLMRKTKVHNNNTECGFWNYSLWITEGVKKDKNNEGPMVLCYTTHLTQFTYLLGEKYKQHDITPMFEKALDVITTIGCILSLLGLLGIWISAAFLSSWRTLASTKILLNMCFALTFQMVLVLFVNQNDFIEKLMLKNSDKPCIIIGASLQYVTLVLFLWMLIIALLQFQRYVTVLGIYRPDHYVRKAAFVAWTLPLIPTLLLVFIDPKSYLPSKQAKETKQQVCYPSEMGLILGVVVPVGAVVVINLTILIYITYTIFHGLKKTRKEKNMLVQKLRLSVFLFFLLGVSWIFGLLNLMGDGFIFSYLFCLTATLQGFVLFLFFIILDRRPRHAWMSLLCPDSYKKRHAKREHEHESMTASTNMGRSISVENRNH